MGGSFLTKQKCLVDFKFPEFSNSKTVTYVVHVDERTPRSTATYDMIIGMDLITELGINIQTSDKSVEWEGISIPLKERHLLNDETQLNTIYKEAPVPPAIKEAEQRQARILDADYSAIDIDEYISTLKHLSEKEKGMLCSLLKEHPQVFQGGLGTLKVKPIHLELKQDAKPYHARAFPIPKSLEAITKKEMKRLTEIGVFKKSNNSEWAAATFVHPKKTGDVRILTDFRRLNAQLIRKPFPLPKISDILQKLSGFRYATAIDLSMGYYHIPLDEESQRLCTTILPWGKYMYQHLPMGIMNSPDIFQSIMMDLLGDLEFTAAYIDDILVTSSGLQRNHY